MRAIVRRVFAAGLLVGLVLVPLAAGSSMTFPGRNGVLVFQSNRDGNYELYRAAADGSNVRKLLSRPSTNEFNPAWSPSGKRLVYQTGPPDGSDFDIELVNADGSRRTPLVTGSTNDRAAQFCDQDTIVFTRQLTPTNSEIYAVETNGTGLRRLTDHPATDSFPTCHPRSGQIAWISSRDGQPRIYAMRPDGTAVQALTEAPSLDPDYAPDGSAVAYVAPDPADRNLEVFTKDLRTGQVVQRSRSAPPFEYRLPKFAPASRAPQQTDGLLGTNRNAQTGDEAVHRLSGGSALPVAVPASGGVQQPQPPCRCERLEARISTDLAPRIAVFKEQPGDPLGGFVRVTLSIAWQMSCTEGAGRCEGRLVVAPDAEDRVWQLSRRPRGQGRTITCVADCGAIRRARAQFRLERGFANDLGTRIQSVGLVVDRTCVTKRSPRTLVIAFGRDRDGPYIDRQKSDLNGDGEADGRKKK